jgi:hypothetical protein
MSTAAATARGWRTKPWFWPLVILAITATYPWWYDVPPFTYVTQDMLGLNLDIAVIIGVYVMLALGLNIVVGYAGLLDLGYVAFFAFGAYTTGVLTGAFLNTTTGAATPALSADLNFFVAVWIVALSRESAVCQGLAFSYGVHPIHHDQEPECWRDFARDWLREQQIPGAVAMLVAGPSTRNPDANHRLEFLRVEEHQAPADS